MSDDRFARKTDPRISRAKKYFVLWLGVTLALCVAGIIAMIVETDRAKSKKLPIIAEVYNSGTGNLAAYVYATNAQHRFENGKVEEAWLMRMIDARGSDPVWFPKPVKAKVVWR